MSNDAKQFWIDRGNDSGGSTLSVTPNATNVARTELDRDRLQKWTLERLHRHGARFDHYVDLGCGTGDFTAALGSEAKQITACDVSPGFVTATRQRLAEIGRTDARVDTADIREFVDYQDASIIYLGGVLMYLDEDGAVEVIRNARERLAPGGLIAVRDWCAIGRGRETRNHHPRFSVHRDPKTSIQLFRAAGFELIEVASSYLIYAEQIARERLRNEAVVRATVWLPRLVAHALTALRTRGSVTFFFRRT